LSNCSPFARIKLFEKELSDTKKLIEKEKKPSRKWKK